MKISIVTFAFLLSPVFSQVGVLSGRPGQQPQLNKAMSDAGIQSLNCMNGYIGIDCTIPNADILSKLSCSLKGKPGKSKNGVFIYNDPENTGISCKQAIVVPTVPTVPYVPPVPTAPVPAACPLITDIQKCMNKCIDDVL